MLETLDYFVEQLCVGAKKACIDYYIADARNPESYGGKKFYEYIEQEDCVLITFNQIGTMLFDDKDSNVWEKYNIPIYDIMVDHPRNYEDALINPLKVLNVLCIDKKHMDYIRTYYPNVNQVNFLPHGGCEEEKSTQEFNEREIDVLYVGSCQQEVNDFPAISILSDGGRELYNKVISLMITDSSYTTEEAIDKYFVENKIHVAKDVRLKLYNTCSFYIETFVRRYYKQLGMQELDKLGINVEIYGDNWEDRNHKYGPNIKIHNRITSKDCNLLSGEAKICLNFMPWFKDGTSERVYNAMLNKSVCVSDRSIYLEEKFEDGENIVFFDLNNPAQMAMDVKFLLENPQVAKFIATNGYNKAKNQDEWENRLTEIISIHQNNN